MSEDDEEKYEGVDELFRYHDESEEMAPLYGLRLEISKEKYTSLFKKWWGALIVKLLGKSISYCILEQHLRDIWLLEKGFELTDLEEGFFIVRFFAEADYMLVLEGGPWVILGHYLSHRDKMETNVQALNGDGEENPNVGKIFGHLAWIFEWKNLNATGEYGR